MQHLSKGLGGGPEVKALSRGVVIGSDGVAESTRWESSKIGFAWHEAAHPADRILDAALLPWGVRIAEEGLDREAVERQVTGELGAVVEGDGLAQLLWQDCKQSNEMACDTPRDLAGETNAKQQTRGALVYGQDGRAVLGEHHQVGLPMARDAAIGGLEGPFVQGNTAFNEAWLPPFLPR